MSAQSSPVGGTTNGENKKLEQMVEYGQWSNLIATGGTDAAIHYMLQSPQRGDNQTSNNPVVRFVTHVLQSRNSEILLKAHETGEFSFLGGKHARCVSVQRLFKSDNQANSEISFSITWLKIYNRVQGNTQIFSDEEFGKIEGLINDKKLGPYLAEAADQDSLLRLPQTGSFSPQS